MELIIENGYYLSDAFHYEDWHAGHKFEKLNYSALWFLDGNKVMSHGKSNHKIFYQNEFFTEGYYQVKNDILTIVYKKNERFELKQEWTLIQKGQIMNENGKIYDFTKWEK